MSLDLFKRSIYYSEIEDIGLDCRITKCDPKPDPISGQYILYITKSITPEHYGHHIKELVFSYQIQNASDRFFRDDVVIFDSLVGLIDLGKVILEPNKSLYLEHTYLLTKEDYNKVKILSNAYVAKKLSSGALGPRTSNVASASISRGISNIEITGGFTSKSGITTGFASIYGDGYVLDPIENKVFLNISLKNTGTAPLIQPKIAFKNTPKGYSNAIFFINETKVSVPGIWEAINDQPTFTFEDTLYPSGYGVGSTTLSVTFSFPIYNREGESITTISNQPGGTEYQDSWIIAPVTKNHLDLEKKITFPITLTRIPTTIEVIGAGELEGPICLNISPIYNSQAVIIEKCKSSNSKGHMKVNILLNVYIFGFRNNKNSGIQTALSNSDVIFTLQ